MNEYEEKLQRAVERDESGRPDNLDEKAYREVFRALKRDPGYRLDMHFAERVAASAMGGRRSNFTDYFWLAFGIGALLVVFAGALLYAGFSFDPSWLRIDMGFLSVMSDYKGLAIFGVLFIVMLNWLDKRLVRRETHS